MLNNILYPSSYFDATSVNEEYAGEYKACLETGLFSCAVFNYDEWLDGKRLKVTDAPKIMKRTLYRGWMLQAEKYDQLYKELKNYNLLLETTPECYKKMHIFPEIYESIKENTARMLIYPEGSVIRVDEIKRNFDIFMVKDYVKSVKDTDFPKYFESSITQSEFDEDIKKFRNLRGYNFTGGICIKEYLHLRKYNGKTNEYRVFYDNYKFGTVCRNSMQENDTPEPPDCLIEKYANLGSPFYTIDYAELEDGSWKIIEAGDGGVSGLSAGQDEADFYHILFRCFNSQEE
jgi:hypothetical protein